MLREREGRVERRGKGWRGVEREGERTERAEGVESERERQTDRERRDREGGWREIERGESERFFFTFHHKFGEQLIIINNDVYMLYMFYPHNYLFLY